MAGAYIILQKGSDALITASAQPMRSEGELLDEVQRIAAEEDVKRLVTNHNHSDNNNPRVKNYYMPLSVKIAMRSLDHDSNNNKTTSLAKQTAADDEDNNVPDVQSKQVSISSTSTSVRDQPLTVKWLRYRIRSN